MGNKNCYSHYYKESIIPSKHKSEDIIWDPYINRPRRDVMDASKIFI